MAESRPPKPKRRWHQFSVGTSQVAMLVLPVALLLILGPLGCGDKPAQAPNRAKQAPSTEGTSRDAVAEIERLGGTVRRYAATSVERYLVADLNGTDITDASLVEFNGLNAFRVLVLDNTQITGVGLEHLKGLSNLKTLSLTGTQITDEALERLKGLHQLQTLDLSANRVTDAGLKHLTELSDLSTLRLWDTLVTDRGLENLQGLSGLQRLFLGHTRVTDAGLEHLKRLDQLQTLNLRGTWITDDGIEYLIELNQLKVLDVGRTRITDVGLEHLERLTSLEKLHLRGSLVSNVGATELLRQLPNATTYPGPDELPTLDQLAATAKVTPEGLQSLDREGLSHTNRHVPTDVILRCLEEIRDLQTLNLHDMWVRLRNRYAWVDADFLSSPVATKKPNDLGGFDFDGSAREWCHERYIYTDTENTGDMQVLLDNDCRVVRNGSFLRGSGRAGGDWCAGAGFRPARTYR